MKEGEYGVRSRYVDSKGNRLGPSFRTEHVSAREPADDDTVEYTSGKDYVRGAAKDMNDVMSDKDHVLQQYGSDPEHHVNKRNQKD
jgi:hypothetical protein